MLCLGSLASLSFLMSFTVVNKMSSRLAGPTLQIICKQIAPLLAVCLFTLALVYMEEARALCLKQRGLFGSVQIWPLSFHAIVSSPRLSLPALPKSPYFHTVTVIRIAFRRPSG